MVCQKTGVNVVIRFLHYIWYFYNQILLRIVVNVVMIKFVHWMMYFNNQKLWDCQFQVLWVNAFLQSSTKVDLWFVSYNTLCTWWTHYLILLWISNRTTCIIFIFETQFLLYYHFLYNCLPLNMVHGYFVKLKLGFPMYQQRNMPSFRLDEMVITYKISLASCYYDKQKS